MIRIESDYAFPQTVVLVCDGCIMYKLLIDHVPLDSASSLVLDTGSLHPISDSVPQLLQEPAAIQLRHLYNLGSWVRMWFRTFLSRKNVLLQSGHGQCLPSMCLRRCIIRASQSL